MATRLLRIRTRDMKIKTRRGHRNMQRADFDAKRVEDMKYLRFMENWGLQEIGDKYGICRERVRQLIGNTGRGYKAYGLRKRALQHPDMTNDQLGQWMGVTPTAASHYRNGTRHALAGGTVKVGGASEDAVSSRLNEFGIAHKQMPHHHSFDIMLADGRRIEVKSSLSRMRPASQRGYGFYAFHVRRNLRGDYADFFILFIVPENVMFVVPSSAVGKSCAVIRLPWPPSPRKPSKWHQYRERFDLLK